MLLRLVPLLLLVTLLFQELLPFAVQQPLHALEDADQDYICYIMVHVSVDLLPSPTVWSIMLLDSAFNADHKAPFQEESVMSLKLPTALLAQLVAQSAHQQLTAPTAQLVIPSPQLSLALHQLQLLPNHQTCFFLD